MWWYLYGHAVPASDISKFTIQRVHHGTITPSSQRAEVGGAMLPPEGGK
jgi:hypothetical protein